jgi:hypothetical protein
MESWVESRLTESEGEGARRAGEGRGEGRGEGLGEALGEERKFCRRLSKLDASSSSFSSTVDRARCRRYEKGDKGGGTRSEG